MSKDLATIAEGPASIESYANNLSQKLSMAVVLLKSGMLPNHYRSPESVLTAILYGRELGFSPIRALNSITVINGKPTLEAQALKSLAIAHGGRIKTLEWTDTVCTLECTRGDWTDSASYTWQDATRAGLTSKDNWKRMPKAMLYARAVSILVRNMFADILGGLYSREEMADETLVERPKVTKIMPMPDGDDIPEHFIRDPAKVLQNAIDGEDLEVLAGWVITTRCSLQGQSVREAYQADAGKLRANVSKLTDLDRKAVEAFLSTIEGDVVIDLDTGEVTNV
jgi:hypothetical protein